MLQAKFIPKKETKVNERVNILVIEDDPSINEVVCKRLEREGYEICAAFSGTEARMLLGAGVYSQSFDLVITDLMLPGLAGDELVSLIRNSASTEKYLPVIVISARTSSKDKVDLLSLGADDYLSKPFDLDELVARVQVQLRKSSLMRHLATSEGNSSCPLAPSLAEEALLSDITLGRIAVDESQRRVTVDGIAVPLTRTEFELLILLLRHPKVVFTKQELYEHIWHEPYPGQENSVSAHVSNIRSKLKRVGADEYIQTVWGIGFKVAVPETDNSES